jgi:LCP family protein required for cell wall assembly
MLRLPGGRALAAKAVYGLSCVVASLVLAVAAVGYYAQKQVDSIGTSSVAAGGPSTGAMNILIMGLESRTYFNGTPLDHHLTHFLDIGSVGGEQTNTLILLHIFAGGQKAVAFSIPRDDYVQLYGTLGYAGTPSKNKIDDAYNAGMQQEMINDQTTHPHWSSAQVNFDGNEAGRQAAVDTVEALTGVKIDKIAELNLIGFYELANEFGGAEVCVKPWPGGHGYAPNENLSDPKSGVVLKPGYQLLSPEQTLAFVRARDSLPEGDLDRTARQQAILDYVLWKLKTEGILSDVGKLNSLLAFARQYMVTSANWNLLQFAGEMDALSGQNLTFHTLPILGNQDVPVIGSVNTVNVASIQETVQRAFATPPGSTTKSTSTSQGKTSSGKTGSGKKTAPAKAPSKTKPAAPVLPASSVTVDAYNSSQTPGLAGTLSQALTAKGYKAGLVQEYPTPLPLTTITYGAGAAGNAAQIAKYFGLTATASSTVAAGHVQVILGGSVTALPAALGGPAATPSATPSASASPTSVTPGITTANGNAITVAPNAKYGIPCVY